MRKIYVPQAQANLGRVIHAKMIEVVDDSVIFVISYMPQGQAMAASVYTERNKVVVFFY